MNEERKLPPLHARLFWYDLTPAEMALLKAMVEHCWDGSVIWASVARLSAYSKLAERTVQNLLHGWDDKRTKRHNPGLVDRGILMEIAKANPSKRRPVTYRLNEAALVEDPKMLPYREQELQEPLLGIDLAAVPGQPVRTRLKQLPGVYVPPKRRQSKLLWRCLSDEFPTAGGHAPLVQPLHQSLTTIAPVPLVQPLRQSGATTAPNYLIDSRRSESVGGFGSSPGVEIVKNLGTPSTTDKVPPQLATGLREIVPHLDGAAIGQIWKSCKANAADCTADEVLYFARSKAPALERAHNPPGLLICSVPQAVTPEALIALRARREREEKALRAIEQERADSEADDRREIEQYQRQQQLERRAAAELEGWPAEKKNALKNTVAAELFTRCPEARHWPHLRDQIHQLMVKCVVDSWN